MKEIPLTSNYEQLFSTVLSGNTYDIRVAYNSRIGFWSISFSQEGVDVVVGVPLLGGVDIMRQYDLPIENMFVVNLDDALLDANALNLGSSARLFILDDEEVPV